MARPKITRWKNRLTDAVIDKIQNFYGQAIRSNTGDLEGMKNSV